MNYQRPDGSLNTPKAVTHIVLGLVVLFIMINAFPFGTVGAGERGIRLRFNAPTGEVLSQGLYFRIPFVERVVKMDVQTQKIETDAVAYSKDLQTVDSKIALNYHLNPEQVKSLYTDIGVDYRERIVSPAIQESVKAATARFTAQELIDQRPLVKDAIKLQLTERLGGKYISVDDFSIINFDFSSAYEKAIETKQIAQQEALAEKNKLEAVKFQADQRIAQAKAEAEAIRIQAEAITQQGGAEYVRLKSVEKWDGKLPQQFVPGSALPFLNLNQ